MRRRSPHPWSQPITPRSIPVRRDFSRRRDDSRMNRPFAFALLAALALPAGANVLYKSVDPNGTVMFSDTPPPEGSRILEERPIGAPASSYPGDAPGTAPPAAGLEEAFAQIDYDAALAQANQRLDLAERALAQARSATASRFEGLRLPAATPVSNASADHIEFLKRDVRLARQALLDLLRSRQLASGRKPRDG